MGRVALFAGLIVDEEGKPVEVTHVGAEPYYVVDDAGFHRHIPTEYVDRQILRHIQENVMAHRELVVHSMLEWMGRDDLFTKAAIEASISQMGEHMERLFQVGIPEETRTWLGLLGFSVVIDMHGDVLQVNMPEATDDDG